MPDAIQFSTRTAAAASTIASGTAFIETGGYAAVGDGGSARYNRQTSAPANTTGSFQSADGAWWVIQPEPEGELSFYAFGVFPDIGVGYAADPGELSGRMLTATFATQTDRGAAIQAVMNFCAAQKYVLRIPWQGSDRVCHTSIQIVRPSGLMMCGPVGGGESVFDDDGYPIDLNRTFFLRGMTSLNRWVSLYKCGGSGDEMIGGWDTDFIIDFNRDRWSVSGSETFLGGDAVTYCNTQAFVATRIGALFGYRHGVNLTCATDTRSGTPFSYPTVTGRPTLTDLVGCWSAFNRDDGVTTHGVGDGTRRNIKLLDCAGYNSMGLYTENSNGVEIDDDSLGVYALNPKGVHCAVGVQIKGHSDAKAPNLCEVEGGFSNYCATPFEIYHTDHGYDRVSPQAIEVSMGDFVALNPTAHPGGQAIGDSNIQSYRHWSMGTLYFDGAGSTGPQILMIFEGAGTGTVGGLVTKNAAGWDSGLRVTSTASHAGVIDTITVGDLISIDDQGPLYMLYHSGGLNGSAGAIRSNRNTGLAVGTAVARYTNDTTNFFSVGRVSGGTNYTQRTYRTGVSDAAINGSFQVPGQLIWNGNGGNVVAPSAGLHLGASEVSGQPYLYVGSTRVTAATSNFIQGYVTGSTRSFLSKSSGTSVQAHIGFETSSALVGNIYASSSGLYLGDIADSSTAVFISAVAQEVRPMLDQDNEVNLGSSSARWKQLFAGTATINTSDAREKALLGPVSAEAELLDAIGDIDLQLFQFLDAVAKKGPDLARIHVGPTAQAVYDALQRRGLDPHRYALWCEDPVLETVEVDAVEDRPVLEDVEVQRATERLEDGRVVVGVETVVVQREKLVRYPVVDEQGKAVTDADGEPLFLEKPLIEAQKVRVTEERPKLDDKGRPLTRLGLREGHLLYLLVARERVERERLERRLEALEKRA